MQIYEVRVTPEVARLRQGDAGTRNVSVVLTFSRQPTYYVGEPPRELAEDPGLAVRRLSAAEANHALRGSLVSAHRCPAELIARSLSPASVAAEVSAAHVPPAGDFAARLEALERAVADLLATDPVSDLEAVLERLPEIERDELVALHEQVLGKKPHGNARDDSIRDAIREALTPGAEKE